MNPFCHSIAPRSWSGVFIQRYTTKSRATVLSWGNQESVSCRCDYFTLTDCFPGKTYCLTYILARRLWERKSTTYQKDKNTVIWFSEGGALSLPAARLPSKALGKDTWHLFDSNEDLYGMPSNLANARGWLIQASPPERDRYKRWVKEEDADMIWMEPVPWHEMYIMG